MPVPVPVPVSCKSGNSLFICRLGDRKLPKRIRDVNKKMWTEMGAITLTFTAHTNPDGRLVIDM